MKIYPPNYQKSYPSLLLLVVICIAWSFKAFAQSAFITISSQPVPQLVQDGGSASFSVSASSDLPLFYQWLHNGTNIPGANRSSLSLSKVTLADVGSYTAQVSNSSRTNQSQPGILNVYPSGTFPFRALLTGEGTIAFDPPGINCGPNCRAYGSGTKVSMKITPKVGWRFDYVGFSGCPDGNTDCILNGLKFAGTDTTKLTDWTYFTTLSSIQTGTIRISPPAPVVVKQPENQTAHVGTNITLSVVATGVTDLTYQWLNNGHPRFGATDSTFTLTNVSSFDSGNYSVIVSALGSSVTSHVAVIKVLDPPINDNFGSSELLTGYVYYIGASNRDGTREEGESEHGGLGGSSIWFSWTAPTTAKVEFDTVGSTFDTLLAIYTGDSLTNLTLVAKDDQSGGNDTSKAIFNAETGVTYHIAVDGYKGATGNVELHFVVQQFHVNGPAESEGLWSLNVTGVPNTPFSVETSTDLVDWTLLGTSALNDGGLAFYGIPDPHEAKRFFRLKTP